MSINKTEIKYGEPATLGITITNLADIPFGFTDIVNVIFALKNDADDDDTDAVFNKALAHADVSIDVPNEKIIVKVDVADYGAGKIESNGEYLMILLIDWGDGILREDKDDELERKLVAKKDKWRG